jgi:hypothetical protein
MRTLRSWGMVVACVTVLGAASAWAADDDLRSVDVKSLKRKAPPQWKRSTVWESMGHLIEPDKKEPDKKTPGKKGEAKADPKVKKETAAAAPAEEGLDDNAREEAAFLRRSAACLKLQEIAVRNNDPELMKRAEQLSERAWATYSQHTSNQPIRPTGMDNDVRERYLGSGKLPKEDKP